ncbi:TolC family protein, partial [Vibrio sinaloensis]
MIASCVALASFNSHSQTLEQAVAITLATNPEIKAVFNEFKSAVKQNSAAEGAYLPSIDLDAGIGYERISPADSTGRDTTNLTRKEATVSLTQLIWDGSATLNDMDRTAAEAESIRLQLLSDASDMAL